jgi:hypothetical protein
MASSKCARRSIILNSSLNTLLLVLAGSPLGHLDAAQPPDFSGSYTLIKTKGAMEMKKGSSWTIKIVQTESAIEITKIVEGNVDACKAKLDGTEAPYTSPGGAKGTCAARFNGKTLILDTLVSDRIRSIAVNGQTRIVRVQMHTRLTWRLSSDGRTLTIRNEVDSPTFPLGGVKVIEPWTEIYARS